MDELKGKRILIVEDDVTNMAVYAAALRRSGAIVVQDFWNVNTVAMLSQHLPIDAILLDLMLRYHMDGYDIFDRIRAQPELANIPVIVVTAADPEVEIPKARAKGFAGFIGKPISPTKFPRQIAACISGEPVWYFNKGQLEDFS
jgi:CheY-like chemotaxis protein